MACVIEEVKPYGPFWHGILWIYISYPIMHYERLEPHRHPHQAWQVISPCLRYINHPKRPVLLGRGWTTQLEWQHNVGSKIPMLPCYPFHPSQSQSPHYSLIANIHNEGKASHETDLWQTGLWKCRKVKACTEELKTLSLLLLYFSLPVFPPLLLCPLLLPLFPSHGWAESALMFGQHYINNSEWAEIPSLQNKSDLIADITKAPPAQILPASSRHLLFAKQNTFTLRARSSAGVSHCSSSEIKGITLIYTSKGIWSYIWYMWHDTNFHL